MAKQKNNNSIKSLFPCVKGYLLPTILCPLFMVGEVILEVYIPLLMSYTINYVQVGSLPSSGLVASLMQIILSNMQGELAFVLAMGGIMVVVSLFSLACGMLAARMASVAGMGFAMNVRRKVFYKIQDFSFLNIDKYSTASLVTRCTTDITNVQNTFMQLIRMLVRAPLMFVMATVMAVKIHKDLAIIFIIAVPVLVSLMILIMTKAFPRFQRMLRSFDGMNSGVQENLIGIRVVKSYVREDYEKEKFLVRAKEVMNAQISAERLMICLMPLMQTIMYACKLALVGIGGGYIVNGTLLVGDLSAMITYSVQILNSLLMVGMVAVSLVITKASVTRLNEVLNEEIDVKSDKQSELTVGEGSVEFDNVNFSYSKDCSEPILQNASFAIKPGESVGIIAGTGEGKSTLVQLIPRLYDVSSGSVKVGGHDVRDYSLFNLRESVSMVLQKNVLFSGTIKDNLRWGNPNATDEEIVEACKKAQAHDFIMSFPKGYDTDLGQGGVNVSGGQKQRLCIARALLKNPKILILDDSTSAVDTATDEKIRNALFQMKDATKIIIAQRIASVSSADKIIVMDEGKIVDIGNHKQLIERCPIYQEVYQSQSQEVK